MKIVNEFRKSHLCDFNHQCKYHKYDNELYFSLLIKCIAKVCINELLSEKILNKSLMLFEAILTKLVDVD